jgi:hypothetical protein
VEVVEPAVRERRLGLRAVGERAQEGRRVGSLRDAAPGQGSRGRDRLRHGLHADDDPDRHGCRDGEGEQHGRTAPQRGDGDVVADHGRARLGEQGAEAALPVAARCDALQVLVGGEALRGHAVGGGPGAHRTS